MCHESVPRSLTKKDNFVARFLLIAVCSVCLAARRVSAQGRSAIAFALAGAALGVASPARAITDCDVIYKSID